MYHDVIYSWFLARDGIIYITSSVNKIKNILYTNKLLIIKYVLYIYMYNI